MVFFICWWLLQQFSPFPFFRIAFLSWWEAIEDGKQADAANVYVWQVEGDMSMEKKNDISTTYRGSYRGMCSAGLWKLFSKQDWNHDVRMGVPELVLGYLA